MKTNFIKPTFIASFFITMCISTSAQSPNWSWAIDSNGPANERLLNMVTSESGTIYGAGFFSNPFWMGDIEVPTPAAPAPGRGFPFLSKITPSGEVVWVKTFAFLEEGYRVSSSIRTAVDSEDNAYLIGRVLRGGAVGTFEVDLLGATFTFPQSAAFWAGFILKIDPEGNGVWAKSFTTQAFPAWQGSSTIVIDENDHIYWQTSFTMDFEINGTVYPNSGETDYVLIQLDTDGTYQWVTGLGTLSGENTPLDMKPAAGGGVLMSSTWTGTTLEIGGLSITNPDGLIGLNPDRWIGKINADGNAAWLVREGGTGDEFHGYVTSTPTGGAMVLSLIGAPITLNDVVFDVSGSILTHYSSTGELEQVTEFPVEASGSLSHRIASDGNGTYFLGVAYTTPNITFGNFLFSNAGFFNATRDFVIVAVDASGTPLWAVPVGGNENEDLYDLNYSPNYGIVAQGTFTSVFLDFGIAALANQGQLTQDIFVATLDITSSIANAPGVKALHLYPNPAQEQLMLDLTSINSHQHTLRIFDTRGSLVLSQNVIGGNVERLEVSNLPKGSYVVLINVDGTMHASKFIKQ